MQTLYDLPHSLSRKRFSLLFEIWRRFQADFPRIHSPLLLGVVEALK